MVTMMTDISKLKNHGAEGFIFTAIKTEDTEHNERVHTAFRALADIEFKGDRTIALHSLLRCYEDRGLFEATWENLKELEARLLEVEKQLENKNEETTEFVAF